MKPWFRHWPPLLTKTLEYPTNAAVVPVNPMLVERELEYVLSDSGSKLVVATSELAGKVLPVAKKLGIQVVCEEVKAFIVVNPEYRGKITEEEIIQWAKQQMAAYKYPRIVEFDDELPKSGAGKILWRLLQEREKEKLEKGGG